MSLNTAGFDSAESEPRVIQLQTNGDNEGQELIMSSTVTDFTRKLYNLLQDPAYNCIICWEPERDSFTIKDTNQFTETILPRVFNHSNFSSFVRQLNKYDFHKVKKQKSRDLHHPWTFKHSYFHADRPEDFRYVRRKTGAAARLEAPNVQPPTSCHMADPFGLQSSQIPYSDRDQSRPWNASEESREDLLNKIARLTDNRNNLIARTQALERNYESMGLTLRDVEAAVALRQVKMDSLMEQVVAIPENALNTPSTSTPAHQRRTVGSPLNLPPPFACAPINLEGSDHPLSLLGKDSSTIGHVISNTTLPYLNDNADPPVDAHFDHHY